MYIFLITFISVSEIIPILVDVKSIIFRVKIQRTCARESDEKQDRLNSCFNPALMKWKIDSFANKLAGVSFVENSAVEVLFPLTEIFNIERDRSRNWLTN